MLRFVTFVSVLFAASAAVAQRPGLTAQARDALAEIEDVGGSSEIDYTQPGRPVIGVTLRVSSCNPATFKCLAHLDTLRTVTLRAENSDRKDYDFNDLKPLAGLKSLKSLVLENCLADRDSSCLKVFTNLDVLTISGTAFGDETMKNLAGLTGLKMLSVRGPGPGESCGVTDRGLEYLAGMRNLRVLDLYGTKVRGPGLEHVGKLTSLQELDLEATGVGNGDLKPLAALKGLQTLVLTRTKVTDEGLAHLGGLTQLRKLYLSYCGRRDEKKPDADDEGAASFGGINNAVLGQFGPDGIPADETTHGISCAGISKHLAACKNLQYLEMKGQADIKVPAEVRQLGRIWPRAVIVTDISK